MRSPGSGAGMPETPEGVEADPLEALVTQGLRVLRALSPAEAPGDGAAQALAREIIREDVPRLGWEIAGQLKHFAEVTRMRLEKARREQHG
jgi:hypothetical protein